MSKFVLVIVSIFWPLSLLGSNIDELIVSTRNCEILEAETSDIRNCFVRNRCKRNYFDCDSILNIEVISAEDSVLYNILVGDCYLYSLNQDPALAYYYYLRALGISEDLDSKIAQNEVIVKLIQYNLFIGKRIEETSDLIELQSNTAYDEQEVLRNRYFSYRLLIEQFFIDSTVVKTTREEWYQLLDETKNQYPKLQSDIESTFGIELEDWGFLDESKKILLDAIESASFVCNDYHRLTEFGSLANIGYQYLRKSNEPELALDYFNRAIKVPQTMHNDNNSALLYDWISEAYSKLNKQDSAYHYLKVSNRYKIKSQTTLQELKVKEILAKYNNEKLESDLLVEKQRGQLAFTWLGITGISILSLLLFYRNQLLRNKSTLQKLETNKLEAVLEKQTALQNERTRIAAEMHDDLGGGLTTIKFLGQRMLRKISDIEQKAQLTKIVDNSQHLVSNMSEIIWAMNAGFDTLDSLVAYTRRYASEYLADYELRLIYESTIGDTRIEITGEKRRHLFLVVKELLHNIVKHADATKVSVQWTVDEDNLQIVVSDNGVGIDNSLEQEDYLASNGIQNMHNRIKLLKGHIDWQTDKGTLASISVPLHTLDTPITSEVSL